MGAVIGSVSILFTFMIMMFALILSAGVYILQSLGLARMSEKLGIAHPYYAFIPVYNSYRLGQAADECDRRDGSADRHLKVKLLAVNLAALVLLPGIVAFMIVLIIWSDQGTDLHVLLPAAVFLLTYLLLLALSLLSAVWSYMACYRLYRAFSPGNEVAWLLLSILVNVSLPFLFYFLSANTPVFRARGGGQDRSDYSY